MEFICLFVYIIVYNRLLHQMLWEGLILFKYFCIQPSVSNYNQSLSFSISEFTVFQLSLSKTMTVFLFFFFQPWLAPFLFPLGNANLLCICIWNLFSRPFPKTSLISKRQTLDKIYDKSKYAGKLWPFFSWRASHKLTPDPKDQVSLPTYYKHQQWAIRECSCFDRFSGNTSPCPYYPTNWDI